MLIPDIDKIILSYLVKRDIQHMSLLSKYHYKLTNDNFYSLCYNLLKHNGFRIFKYKNKTISLLKKNGLCISFKKTPRLLLNKIE